MKIENVTHSYHADFDSTCPTDAEVAFAYGQYLQRLEEHDSPFEAKRRVGDWSSNKQDRLILVRVDGNWLYHIARCQKARAAELKRLLELASDKNIVRVEIQHEDFV